MASLTVLSNPPRPGLYAVLGAKDVIPWALEVMTLTFSPKPIVWVDAANRFNAHWVALTARSAYKDPVHVLASYHVARPFTAYQLEAMVTQQLVSAALRHRALFSVIADPLSLYEGAEGRDSQVHQSFKRFIEGLKDAARRIPLILLIPEPGPQRYLSSILNSAITIQHLPRDVGETVSPMTYRTPVWGRIAPSAYRRYPS